MHFTWFPKKKFKIHIHVFLLYCVLIDKWLGVRFGVNGLFTNSWNWKIRRTSLWNIHSAGSAAEVRRKYWWRCLGRNHAKVISSFHSCFHFMKYQLLMLYNTFDRIIGNHPNTYSFTKGLIEQLVYDCKDELPMAIARPPISKYLCNIFYSYEWSKSLTHSIYVNCSKHGVEGTEPGIHRGHTRYKWLVFSDWARCSTVQFCIPFCIFNMIESTFKITIDIVFPVHRYAMKSIRVISCQQMLLQMVSLFWHTSALNDMKNGKNSLIEVRWIERNHSSRERKYVLYWIIKYYFANTNENNSKMRCSRFFFI